MAGLRTLLNFPTGSGSTLNYATLRVWNASINTESNGGACCLWTVPTGVTWVAIEMWGGGGSGAGACCCRTGPAGGSGSYARRIITGLTAGQTFTLCAGGTTAKSQMYCCGCPGNPSFAFYSALGANTVCASGGKPGMSFCQFMVGCSCQGCEQQQCGSFCGAFGLCGLTGAGLGNPTCSGNTIQFMPSAPYTSGDARGTKDACSGVGNGEEVGGCARFPGGGGATAVSHGNNSCGMFGAGGLVEIFYSAPA
jgi:hypothetical protein